MNVLMVGVDKERIGGMWTVADTFISNQKFNKCIKLYYVATSTCGTKWKRLRRMLTGYGKVLKILLTKEIDVVHVHMAEKGSVYRKGVVVYLSKLFGKKVIIQMHAGPILAWYNTLSKDNKIVVSKVFNKADKMLVLGRYWKEQMTALIPEEKIKVLYNGAECPNSNPYNPNGQYVLYLGLFKKTKGTYDLVDAIKKIDDKLPEEVKVYLCGSDETGDMNQYVEKSGLQDRIILPGWISKEQRLELFANAQMCVLPSYFEALSMTVIESMCYGIPMVTTNISTMPELLGNDIELVEPGDIEGLATMILKLNNDVELRKRISSIEYPRAKKNFSVEKIIESTLEIYKNL